jgi:hypothetical protein
MSQGPTNAALVAIVGRELLRLPQPATALDGTTETPAKDGASEGVLRVALPTLAIVTLHDVGHAEVAASVAFEPNRFEWLPEHCWIEKGVVTLAWRRSSGKMRRGGAVAEVAEVHAEGGGLSEAQLEVLQADPALKFAPGCTDRAMLVTADRVGLGTLRRLSRDGTRLITATGCDGGVEVAIRHSSNEVLPPTSAHQRHRASAAQGLWGR